MFTCTVGKKSLVELRQLYFLLKNRIFMKSRYGYGYNSETLEEILKDYLTTDIKMSDVRHPKYVIFLEVKGLKSNSLFLSEFS